MQAGVFAKLLSRKLSPEVSGASITHNPLLSSSTSGSQLVPYVQF